MNLDLFSSTPTPLTPPMLEEDRSSWLRLFRSRRVGVSTFYRMLAEHGSAQAALAALPEVAKAAGVDDYTPCSEADVRAEMRAARKAGAQLICRGDPLYPATLAQIDDAPPLFWAVGRTDLLTRPMIAIVGARNASSLGLRMARRLAAELAERGAVVVSGLARGIDAAAHEGALDPGTAAVMAGGVDVLYPQENRALFEDIGRKGLRISEQPMGLAPISRHFPPRNRIVSGLSQGVIVIEAAARSGSLITARNALDQGREVMAVPGHPFDPRAAGCNMLIRDGARLVRGADDVMESLGDLLDAEADAADWRAQARAHAAAITAPDAARAGGTKPANGAHPPRKQAEKDRSLDEIAALHRRILSQIGPSPISEDQLIRDLGLPPQTLSPALLALELDGRITRQPGGLIALNG